MIRQRQINSVSFSAGNMSVVDLPRDAVYHMIQLSCYSGTWVSVQGAMGTGPKLDANFPFSLIRQVRLIRNGSDVVGSWSGAQLAKESYYLNKAAPFARLYSISANVETLYTASVRGLTVPATPDGINACGGGFKLADAASSSATMYFDFEMEIWLQIGPDDAFYGTLLDARTLASFQLEISWATTASISIAGTANTSDTVTASVAITSIDQDNLSTQENFGTFKRSQLQYSNIPYSTQNYQIVLPRGNFFHGVIFQTRKQHADSAVVLYPENDVLSTIVNRINSNYQLRSFTFSQLQALNMQDAGGRAQPWGTAKGHPQGWAYLYYPSASNEGSELIPTYVMDTFDFQVTTKAISGTTEPSNGATVAATNPTIDMLLEEVIPGVDIGAAAPKGSFAGSTRRTSAKPYG